MFLLLILLSYLLGCASTIALLLYLYTRYALHSPAVIDEQQEEQYPTFHPLPEVSEVIVEYAHVFVCGICRMNERKTRQSMRLIISFNFSFKN